MYTQVHIGKVKVILANGQTHIDSISRASLKTQLINEGKAFTSFYAKNTDWIYVIDQ
jgi:hypothetical protein